MNKERYNIIVLRKIKIIKLVIIKWVFIRVNKREFKIIYENKERS